MLNPKKTCMTWQVRSTGSLRELTFFQLTLREMSFGGLSFGKMTFGTVAWSQRMLMDRRSSKPRCKNIFAAIFRRNDPFWDLLQLSFMGSIMSSSRAQQRASFVIKSVVLEAKNMIRWQWGSSWSSAVEHMPAELNSWGSGFNSHRVLGFLLLLSSVMCPYTGSLSRCSVTVFPIEKINNNA